jgi:2-polyprenyl-6-methoxyphenol hydroxylase-like FAD-dependent oxidoreductase
VITAGGGIAGSTLGGVLARAGLGVLVLEKEARFRDRIRGEGTWPWGVTHARMTGLDDLFDQAGTVEVRSVRRFENQRPVETVWEVGPDGGVPELTFLHPRFQEAAFAWAGAQGATTIRPAKATSFRGNGTPSVTVDFGDREEAYSARLVVGADGKHSMARRWTGGESVADPEHHRMGGVLISGATIDRDSDDFYWAPGEAVNWFAAGPEMTRLYLVMSAQRLHETGVDRSFDAIVAFASAVMPEGALGGVQQEGPIGYFSSSDIWASKIAGNRVALIGDAAGAPDPTQGFGTALIFHDVRVLSELLLSESNWDRAIDAFAERRRRAFEVIREYDRWHNTFFETGEEAARQRERHGRARECDPELGGFGVLEARGPDGLVADEAARRHYFGEDLA